MRRGSPIGPVALRPYTPRHMERGQQVHRGDLRGRSHRPSASAGRKRLRQTGG